MDAGQVRMIIPIEKIRIQGAIPMNEKHPFVDAIIRGPAALQDFYANFQPRNLAEMYNLSAENLRGEELPPWEIPWMARDRRLPPPGEAGLDASHGVSFYGPATRKKVEVEYERLTSVLASIQNKGFQPDRYGDIEGYGLVSQSDYRFFVRGGKHRLAALASLGWQGIPVSFRSNWPTSVYSATLDDWPLVSDGIIAPQTALAIFDCYFSRCMRPLGKHFV